MTSLLAWQAVKPVTVKKEYRELYTLNNSKTHENTLTKEEYTSSAKFEDLNITIQSKFKKSLPFETILSSYENKLVFINTKVSSFGTQGYDRQFQILYYKNDNNFIVSLQPKDTT